MDGPASSRVCPEFGFLIHGPSAAFVCLQFHNRRAYIFFPKAVRRKSTPNGMFVLRKCSSWSVLFLAVVLDDQPRLRVVICPNVCCNN